MIRFVTTNDGKFKEISAFLASKDIKIGRYHKEYSEIQATSLEDVVIYGIKDFQDDEGDIFIEDSGLFVDKLNGFPGVFSSYVYKTIGCEGILKLMLGWKDRNARFETCICLRFENELHLFRGRCKGTISNELKGKGGFGYDPIFIPKGERNTFAQMSIEKKNSLSHRGRAVRALSRFLIEKGYKK